MAITVISAGLTVLGNFLADVLYAYVDREFDTDDSHLLDRLSSNRLALVGLGRFFSGGLCIYGTVATSYDPNAKISWFDCKRPPGNIGWERMI